MENGGTEGAPRGDGPSLKIKFVRVLLRKKKRGAWGNI